MGNPEKLATLGTQDEDKQNKKHHAICVGNHHTQYENKQNIKHNEENLKKMSNTDPTKTGYETRCPRRRNSSPL
jgi:hypothetical protein